MAGEITSDTDTPATGVAPDTSMDTTPGDTLVAADPVKDTGGAADGVGGKQSTAEKLREEASKLGGQAAERARAFAGEGKDKATGALDEVARMMLNAAGEVDAKIGPEYGKYARSAADGIAGFADQLRGKEVDDLIADATAFVRKSPAIAIGTAAAVGFVLARLIKSGIDAATDAPDTTQADDPARSEA